MPRLTKTKLFKVLLVSLFFVGLIFWNPVSAFSPLQRGLENISLPFQKVLHSLTLGFEGGREFLASIGQLKLENEQLHQEKLQLLAENAKLQDVENENKILREQFSLLPRDKFKLAAATVISQDPNGMGNWLEIDKGSDDGLSPGMAVIVSNGILIGKVQQVNASNARVVLLTNPKSTVNVMSLETGAKGVAKGEYGLGIIFDMILQTDSVQMGNSVVTSGIGSEIPKGLYVGKIQEIHPSDDHLFQQAVVAAPLPVSKLQVVFVVLQTR